MLVLLCLHGASEYHAPGAVTQLERATWCFTTHHLIYIFSSDMILQLLNQLYCIWVEVGLLRWAPSSPTITATSDLNFQHQGRSEEGLNVREQPKEGETALSHA